MSKVKNDAHRKDTRWNATYGTYLSGQAAIDGADAMAIAMERCWGVDRLRLLVDTALREKFDRQRFLFNTAIRSGDLQEVLTQSERMVRAWKALDTAAELAGAQQLVSNAPIETTLADGTVVAIVFDDSEAHRVVRSGRRVVVYTLEEIGRMLDRYREVTEAKKAFPGASVTVIRKSIPDPLDAIPDGVSLNDRTDDIAAFQ